MKKISQEQIWNKIAEAWNNFRKRSPSEVEEFLKNKKGKILDLGCGSGRNIFANPYREYYGVDFSGEMLKLAERDARMKKAKAVFFKINFGKEKLNFPSNFFDSAVFISTLHCIETAEARKNALKELYRVMKKNSEAMITVWKKDAMIQTWKSKKLGGFDFSYAHAKELFLNWKHNKIDYKRYYYFYEEKELEQLLKKIGFKIRKDSCSTSDIHSKKNLVFYVKK